MRRFRWQQAVLVLALLVVGGVTGYRAVRAARHVAYWRQHRDDPIRPWMTIGYVAHSYHVPPHVLYQAMGLPFEPHDRRSISRLAQSRGRSTSELIAVLQTAIVHARPPYPPPAPPPHADRGHEH